MGVNWSTAPEMPDFPGKNVTCGIAPSLYGKTTFFPDSQMQLVWPKSTFHRQFLPIINESRTRFVSWNLTVILRKSCLGSSVLPGESLWGCRNALTLLFSSLSELGSRTSSDELISTESSLSALTALPYVCADMWTLWGDGFGLESLKAVVGRFQVMTS